MDEPDWTNTLHIIRCERKDLLYNGFSIKSILLDVRKQERKLWLCFHPSPEDGIVLIGIDKPEIVRQDRLIKASPS